MKKSYFILTLFIALLISTNSYALIYPLKTYQDIMSEEFGLKDDAISIYNEISIKNKAPIQEGLRLTQEWKDALLKKFKGQNMPVEQVVYLCRELMSVCLVGMYYVNQYCFEHKKDNNLLNEYAEIFMNPLLFATYNLGIKKEINAQIRKEIHDIIYMPILRDLATYERQINKKH